MFRRSFWEENNVGYSDEKNLFEDWEFWLRMAKAGARFKEVLPARLMYRIHSSSKVSITDDRLKKQKELTENTLENYQDFLEKERFEKIKEKQSLQIEVKNPRVNLDWEKTPFISIITPVFNGEDFIEDVIKNLESQTYRNFEHIVIDGGSTDGTLDILKKYSDRLVYISESDDGQSDAINKGFKLASGEVLTWLNADDYYASENVLQKVFQEFQDENVNLISATAEVKYLDKDAKDFVVPQLKLDEENFIMWWHYFSIPPQPSIFFRKKVIEEVGLIDTNLHYTMDHDLWLRMVKAGYEFKQIPEVWSVCQIHNQSKTGTSTKKFQLEHEKVAKKYWGSKLSLTYWRRLFQYIYAKYFKYQDHFAK
jgi:glycosyltransferase involved in cell wall biosynthesis